MRKGQMGGKSYCALFHPTIVPSSRMPTIAPEISVKLNVGEGWTEPDLKELKSTCMPQIFKPEAFALVWRCRICVVDRATHDVVAVHLLERAGSCSDRRQSGADY